MDGTEAEGSVVVIKVVQVGGKVVWCFEVEFVGAVKQAGARNVDLFLLSIQCTTIRREVWNLRRAVC